MAIERGKELAPLMQWISQEVSRVVSGEHGMITFWCSSTVILHGLYFLLLIFLIRLQLVLGQRHDTLEWVMNFECWPRSAFTYWMTRLLILCWSSELYPFATCIMKSLLLKGYVSSWLKTLNCEFVEEGVSSITCLKSAFWSVNNLLPSFLFLYLLFVFHFCPLPSLPSSLPREANSMDYIKGLQYPLDSSWDY